MGNPNLGALMLFAAGISEILFPGWNGSFFDRSTPSDDTIHITSTICFVGAAVLLFVPRNS